MPNSDVRVQTVRALLRRFAWKNWPSRSPFQGHSCHRNRHGSIRHLWLRINVP